jgi:hypothetical protein
MKKIISFSLWGNIELYCIGAIKNANTAKKIFPDWICRFYYDHTVPTNIIDHLKNLTNTELIYIDLPSGGKSFKDNGQFGAFWRYFPYDDEDVEIWMARDCDSRISPYEKETIDKFINGDAVLHCFRDENEKLLRAGLFTFKNYSNGKKNTIKTMKELTKHIDKMNTPFYSDEHFLNNIFIHLFKKKYVSSPRKFDKSYDAQYGHYVGQMFTEKDKWLKTHPDKSDYLMS